MSGSRDHMPAIGSRQYHRDKALGLEGNAWRRVGGNPHDPDAPYLHDMGTRQLLMQNAILHATLALSADAGSEQQGDKP